MDDRTLVAIGLVGVLVVGTAVIRLFSRGGRRSRASGAYENAESWVDSDSSSWFSGDHDSGCDSGDTGCDIGDSGSSDD